VAGAGPGTAAPRPERLPHREILALAGLLDDDRVPALDAWAESGLADLAPGIAACTRSWLHALRDGTPRTRAS